MPFDTKSGYNKDLSNVTILASSVVQVLHDTFGETISKKTEAQNVVEN